MACSGSLYFTPLRSLPVSSPRRSTSSTFAVLGIVAVLRAFLYDFIANAHGSTSALTFASLWIAAAIALGETPRTLIPCVLAFLESHNFVFQFSGSYSRTSAMAISWKANRP